MNISELITRKSRGRSPSSTTGVSIAVIKNGHQETGSTTPYCLSFGIMTDVMKQMRFVIGDRVTLDIEPINSTATIRRVLATEKLCSWKLSSRKGGKKGESKKCDGLCESATFKFSADDKVLKALGMDGLEKCPSFFTDYTTSEKGITFPLPKPYTVATKAANK